MKKRSHLFNVSLRDVDEISITFYLRRSTHFNGRTFFRTHTQRVERASVTSQSNFHRIWNSSSKVVEKALDHRLEVFLIPKSYLTSRLEAPVLRKNNKIWTFLRRHETTNFSHNKSHKCMFYTLAAESQNFWYLKLNLVSCMNQSVFMVSMLCCLLVVPIPNKFSTLIAIWEGVCVCGGETRNFGKFCHC